MDHAGDGTLFGLDLEVDFCFVIVNVSGYRQEGQSNLSPDFLPQSHPEEYSMKAEKTGSENRIPTFCFWTRVFFSVIPFLLFSVSPWLDLL